MPYVNVKGESQLVRVVRNKHRSAITYHVVAGCQLLGQIVKHSDVDWEAQIYRDVNLCRPKFEKRQLAVNYLVEVWNLK